MMKALLIFALCIFTIPVFAEQPATNLSTDQLVAWCIVPFDASQRTPEQRAAMLKSLGIKRSAYDWRKQHITEFEREIQAYQKHGIEFFAFWKGHEEAFQLFQKYDIQPQIWHTLASPKQGTQEEKIAEAVKKMEPLANRTKELGCQLGLYNHGGWGGEAANLVAVCLKLREMGHDHVGIVYNWHHGHARIENWQSDLELMKPYLHCLNLNGMNASGEPKILTLDQGEHEKEMLQVIIDSGYQGPIGILDHRNELDTEKALRDNLAGLKNLLQP